jgi:lipoprotein-anchoring transpeptidase ErfK/SrfK
LAVKRKKQKIYPADNFQLIVSIADQKLYFYKKGKLIRTYRVSTSKYGIGNKNNSFKTPLGKHLISSKIGRKARLNSIFKDRRNTKKISKLGSDFDKDLITTRILRLQGLEPGKNKGEGIDTFDRGIYIHGTAEEHLIGKPASHGCIRMKNKDIAELFDLVPRGTVVDIKNLD